MLRKIRRVAWATALAVVATASAASAFVTPALQGSDNRWMSCRVLNTDIVPHDVTIKIVQVNTGVVKLQNTVTLKPATTRSVWGYSDAIAYCEVTGIDKSLARTTFCLETNLGNCVSLVTVP